jgi:hypothetical protein
MNEPLARLREIFWNEEFHLVRRIEAAEIVLAHEGPPDIIADAIKFLESVTDTNYVVYALKVLARRTQPKVTQHDVAGEGFAARLQTARLKFLANPDAPKFKPRQP